MLQVLRELREERARDGARGGGAPGASSEGAGGGGRHAHVLVEDAGGLQVIIGRGRATGGSQLGPAMLQMLREGRSGAARVAGPPIEAQLAAGNQGRILINGQSLQRWLDATSASSSDQSAG